MDDKWHGTNNGYNNYGCRCDACKAKHAEYQKARRAVWKQERLDEDGVQHGQVSTFDANCRCVHCCRANEKRLAFYAKTYFVGADKYAAAVASQNGHCAICNKVKKLVPDHDHENNVFRGLLCTSCNVSIGNLGDNAAGLQRALDYLTK